MARDSLALIITELRVLTDNVVTEDSPLVDTSVWDDDALAYNLEAYGRRDLIDVEMTPFMQTDGDYYLYNINVPPYFMLEEPAEGEDAICTVVDGSGIQPAGYTINYDQKTVEFLGDTDGKTYYLRGVAYNLHAAAAQVWLRKAALRSSMISIKAGDHTLREDQEYQHCMDMYNFFSGNKLKTLRLRRSDYA